MDKDQETTLQDLRQVCLEVRDSLRVKQASGKYPKEWSADINTVVDILEARINAISDELLRRRKEG